MRVGRTQLWMSRCIFHQVEFFNPSTTKMDIYKPQLLNGLPANMQDISTFKNTIPFPLKLHAILEKAEIQNFRNIISWLPDNNSFRVHQPDAFVEMIMPHYFRQTKYKSFQRQLNMWGFERLLTGPHKGGYTHIHFVRSDPSRCSYMRRMKIKGVNSKARAQSTTTSLELSLMPRPVISIGKSSLSAFSSVSTEPNATSVVVSSKEEEQQQQSKFQQQRQALQQQQWILHKHMILQKQRLYEQAPLPNKTLLGSSVSKSEDLFDEETLSSVLSSALQNPTSKDQAPQDGDSVFFEGMNFFSIEDFKWHNGNEVQRRMPC